MLKQLQPCGDAMICGTLIQESAFQKWHTLVVCQTLAHSPSLQHCLPVATAADAAVTTLAVTAVTATAMTSVGATQLAVPMAMHEHCWAISACHQMYPHEIFEVVFGQAILSLKQLHFNYAVMGSPVMDELRRQGSRRCYDRSALLS